MDYSDDCRDFLEGFLTTAIREKYHIKSIKKANVCFGGKGILAPYFEVYVKAVLDDNQKEEIKKLIVAAYKEYYKTDILPGINILSSALFVEKYKDKYYHLCVAKDSWDRNFVDYEIFELLPEGYEAVLNMEYAMYQTEYDKRLVKRINVQDSSVEDEYMEIYKNMLSEKLLEMVLSEGNQNG